MMCKAECIFNPQSACTRGLRYLVCKSVCLSPMLNLMTRPESIMLFGLAVILEQFLKMVISLTYDVLIDYACL